MASYPKKAKAAVVTEKPQLVAEPAVEVAPAAKAAPVIESAPVPAPAPIAVKVEVAKAVEAPHAVQASVRAIVEKGLVATRARYEDAKASAEQASAAVEASLGAAQSGVLALNVKAIEAIKAGADAHFAFLEKLTSAKSLSEAVTLQTEFARKQFDEASARAKDLAELARKVADQTAAPIKAHVAKTFKTAV